MTPLGRVLIWRRVRSKEFSKQVTGQFPYFLHSQLKREGSVVNLYNKELHYSGINFLMIFHLTSAPVLSPRLTIIVWWAPKLRGSWRLGGFSPAVSQQETCHDRAKLRPFSLRATLDMAILIKFQIIFNVMYFNYDICGQRKGIKCNDNRSPVFLHHQQTFISSSCHPVY